MGAKLKELLGLPSLRDAQLMSGQNCLNQTVTSLSFLDISDMDDYLPVFETNEYHSGELALTSFSTSKTTWQSNVRRSNSCTKWAA